MTSSHTYPRAALLADYARASVGLVLATMAILLPLHWILATGFGAVAALLLFFGARTLVRQRSRIEISPDGIALIGPFGRRIAWTALDGFRLRYFSMRRDRKLGWMELLLEGGGKRIAVESQIQGFEDIVTAAAEAAGARRLALDEASETNLAAMGVAVPRLDRDDFRSIRPKV
ncbi:MAG TPA: hypothetical protein VM689_14500 [Aliidongia sp.]|nr:hypothetical protein [Aliidongia sp.]